MAKKIKVPEFALCKEQQRKFVMITCYDYTISSGAGQSPGRAGPSRGGRPGGMRKQGGVLQ